MYIQEMVCSIQDVMEINVQGVMCKVTRQCICCQNTEVKLHVHYYIIHLQYCVHLKLVQLQDISFNK